MVPFKSNTTDAHSNTIETHRKFGTLGPTFEWFEAVIAKVLSFRVFRLDVHLKGGKISGTERTVALFAGVLRDFLPGDDEVRH